jgi:hypothetical protein
MDRQMGRCAAGPAGRDRHGCGCCGHRHAHPHILVIVPGGGTKQSLIVATAGLSRHVVAGAGSAGQGVLARAVATWPQIKRLSSVIRRSRCRPYGRRSRPLDAVCAVTPVIGSNAGQSFCRALTEYPRGLR